MHTVQSSQEKKKQEHTRGDEAQNRENKEKETREKYRKKGNEAQKLRRVKLNFPRDITELRIVYFYMIREGVCMTRKGKVERTLEG